MNSTALKAENFRFARRHESQPARLAAKRALFSSIDTVLALVLGVAFGIPITTSNPVYAGEALSLLLLIAYVVSRKLEKTITSWRLKSLVIAMFLTAIGYVATDLILQTPAENYIRGWARLAVTVVNILALVCFANPVIKRLDKIALGFAVSSVLSALMLGDKFVWKFDGAVPLAIAAAVLATFLPAIPGSLVLLCAGILNLALDCRNAGGISIMVAAFVFARLPKAVRKKTGFLPVFLVGLLVAGGLYAGYRLALSDYSERQAESNAGRRADIEVAIGEIAHSPIIGHGSWFYSADMQAAIAGRYAELTGHSEPPGSADISAGHSAVLQTWFEGGILGALLFFLLIGKIVQEIPRQMLKDSSLPISPLFITLMAVACWDLMMSPFAGIHRITISLGTAALFANQYGDRVLAAIRSASQLTPSRSRRLARI